jgi:membrane associated rhomboid family serine protease
MAGLIAMIVQLYFTWRIWILSSSYPLAIFIGLISVAQGIAGLVAGIQVCGAFCSICDARLSSLIFTRLFKLATSRS